MSKTQSKTANVEDNKKVLYWTSYDYKELWILTRKDWDKYLAIHDALADNHYNSIITWNDYKKLLNDDYGFDQLYNAWLDQIDSRNIVENFRELVKKIHKGIDISDEKDYEEIKWLNIHLDSPMPELSKFIGWYIDSYLANHPGYFLYDSLPQDICEEYWVVDQDYLDWEKKDEIFEKLKSRGYKLIETYVLPF